MIIKTTINVRTDYLALLESAIAITGKSRRSIVSWLMIRLAIDHDMLPKQWKRIRYQDRGNKAKYKRVHISLNESEYELFLDLKKFCKQSVSRLVACSIDLYLDELIKYFSNNDASYPPLNYIMNKIIVDGSICWYLQWGVPIPQAQIVPCIT